MNDIIRVNGEPIKAVKEMKYLGVTLDRNESAVGVWTRRLIPNIETWMGCEFRVLEYGLVQSLTGHGSLRSYPTG